MLFTSPVFLLLFLPLMLGIYTLVPSRLKPSAICVFSLIFYAMANFGNPASLLFLLLCAIFTYCATFAAFSVRKKYVMVFIICVLVGVLAVLRYLGVWADVSAAARFIPIGASFYLLACFSCVMDVRRGDAPMPRNFADILIYITYFPVMIAGPVIKYKNFQSLIKPENLHFSAAGIASGIMLFARGFIKRIAIAALLEESYDSIVDRLLHYTEEPLSIGVAVILAALLLISVYYAFSGYSDMGRGISAMLGIHLAPDFGACILAITPADYANNFLSSLSMWIDDYIRRPLSSLCSLDQRQGNSQRILSTAISLFCSLVVLLWFKIGISVLPAIALLLVPTLLDALFGVNRGLRAKKQLWPLGWVYTFSFVTLFWMLIKTRDLSSLEIIFGNITLWKPLQSYLMSSTLINLEILIALAIMVIIQLPVICGIVSRRHGSPFVKSNAFIWIWSLLVLIIFILCIYYYLPQYPALSTMPFRDIIF
jgi:alginate O-acetyltransferase complex protein AlgI